MSPYLLREHSARLTENLRNRLDIGNFSCVAGYMANDGEIDLSRAFSWFHENGITVAVPHFRKGEMRFARLTPQQQFVRGAFDILEPDRIESVHLSSIDLMLLPLVAFSTTGNRLGRGGGHYDRMLEPESRPMTLGIAHEFQLNDEFSTKLTDVSLDAVVTEQQWRLFSAAAGKVLREN
ncbi:MAG: 5-formyltetrahydrofolate cyclo-ligase [Gammaproteobacteria bacterium]|nr:5-formyltetrahydrofolate cyclo-ligase [Gammaproteobacteria bacterium]MYD80444.1 5-formyltetrahydrofolate cyclo-ligase [Gammaproteobacteria bacterium]